LTTHSASHCATRNKGKPSRSHPSLGLTVICDRFGAGTNDQPFALARVGQPDVKA
jgi:hypothetical protein